MSEIYFSGQSQSLPTDRVLCQNWIIAEIDCMLCETQKEERHLAFNSFSSQINRDLVLTSMTAEDLYEEQKENFKDNTDLVIIHNTDNHCNGIK